jgi:hypothetical protein
MIKAYLVVDEDPDGAEDWEVMDFLLMAAASMSRGRRARIAVASVVMHLVQQVTLRERRPNLHRNRDEALAKIRAMTDAEFARHYRLTRPVFYALLDEASGRAYFLIVGNDDCILLDLTDHGLLSV